MDSKAFPTPKRLNMPDVNGKKSYRTEKSEKKRAPIVKNMKRSLFVMAIVVVVIVVVVVCFFVIVGSAVINVVFV